MKSMKVAAIIAGSVMVLGAAGPAAAAGEGLNLNNGLDTVASQGLRDPKPLNTNALDTENPGSVLNAVKGVTDGLNKKKDTKGAKKKISVKKKTGKDGKGKSSKVGKSNKGTGKGGLLGGLSLDKVLSR
ncbi:hypothetical protein ACIOJD_27900 [Streptomyces sp. NPDC088116]|uniref:hypothetical protein n=1 Tax=Streptomyces sp. NPDC088116 TaxID=3365825 RepID=UPI00380DD9BB